MALEINFNDETQFLANQKRDWKTWIQQLLDLAQVKVGKQNDQELSINFVSAEKSQQINRDYRGRDRPTDVISFAIEDGDLDLDLAELIDEGYVEDLGDLFMCIDVIKRHAEEYETGFDREFGYTLVHGYLHLSGYDHIEPAEAKAMFGLQGEVLAQYGLKLYPDQLDEGRGK